MSFRPIDFSAIAARGQQQRDQQINQFLALQKFQEAQQGRAENRQSQITEFGTQLIASGTVQNVGELRKAIPANASVDTLNSLEVILQGKLRQEKQAAEEKETTGRLGSLANLAANALPGSPGQAEAQRQIQAIQQTGGGVGPEGQLTREPGDVAGQQLNQLAGLIDQRQAEALTGGPGFQTFVEPEGGRPLRSVPSNSLEARRLAASGAIQAPINLQGDPSTLFPKKEVAAAAADVVEFGGKISTFADVRQQLERVGAGLVGFRGAASEFVMGTVGQLNQSLGSNLTKFISNTSPEELQSFRLKVKALAAQAIPLVTAEQGGRVTDTELRIATQTTALANTLTSMPQAVGALDGLMQLAILTQERKKFVAGIPLRDLESDADVQREMLRLANLGMGPRVIVDTINLMIEQRGELNLAVPPELLPRR